MTNYSPFLLVKKTLLKYFLSALLRLDHEIKFNVIHLLENFSNSHQQYPQLCYSHDDFNVVGYNMMITTVKRRYSLDEYRAIEEKAEGHNEYDNGEIVPMTG